MFVRLLLKKCLVNGYILILSFLLTSLPCFADEDKTIEAALKFATEHGQKDAIFTLSSRHGDSEAVTRGNTKLQSLAGQMFQNLEIFALLCEDSRTQSNWELLDCLIVFLRCSQAHTRVDFKDCLDACPEYS